jgi:ethanolamine utilization cobalamin adenosyltransferase
MRFYLRRMTEMAQMTEQGGAKPDHMTHLCGNALVAKTHPRITLRGKLDSLLAFALLAQRTALDLGEKTLAAQLGDILACVRAVLTAEITEKPLVPPRFFGLDAETIHARSHDSNTFFGVHFPRPAAEQGTLCLWLNLLRTQVRETELAAAHAFSEVSGYTRADIPHALNRLSSAVYLLYLSALTKKEISI